MDRRNFLRNAAGSVLGYSVIAVAPQTLMASTERALAANANTKTPQGKHSLTFNPIMKSVALNCDVLVSGGGLAGIAAALSAARKGSKVVLVQNRSRLGGNSSSEIRMHPMGLKSEALGQREGGIIEELKLENAAKNPLLSWEVWDLMLYDKCVSEPNITLLLDTSVYSVEKKGSEIKAALARSDADMTEYKISAKMFVDASGDSLMAISAGAEIMTGREGPDAFGEKRGGYDEIGTRQGSSIMFTTKTLDHPAPYKAPSWAKKLDESHFKNRPINNNFDFGYWWIELGGVYDAIRDNNLLRRELLAIIFGIWDYIKNSGKFPEADNRVLDWIGMVPGRRDTVRIVGDRILTQHDIEGKWREFDDAVAVGGWPMDDHPKGGFFDSNRGACAQDHSVPYYNIPFSCLYAKGLDNLLMAGRNISCSHVAFTSTRVMCTCAAMGQAAGTAAHICAKSSTTPRKLRNTPSALKALQNELLRDDQTIIGVSSDDPRDLARKARVSASESAEGSKPENVVSGSTLDFPKQNLNRWVAPAAKKPWIKLEWDAPQKISQVRIVFDSLFGPTTQTSIPYLLKAIKRGPERCVVKDYTLTAILPNGSEKVLADVKGNYQKLAAHKFKQILAKGIRIDVSATNGAQQARIKEIRAEA